MSEWRTPDGRMISLLTPAGLRALQPSSHVIAIDGATVRVSTITDAHETRGGYTAYGLLPVACSECGGTGLMADPQTGEDVTCDHVGFVPTVSAREGEESR